MILDEIIAAKQKSIKALKALTTIEDFKMKIKLDAKRNIFSETIFERVLKHEGMSVIAEIKKASPSKGIICDHFNPGSIAKQYQGVEADAISVLTEEDFFLGSPDHLREVKGAVDIPVLRKDFIIDPWQVYEAKYLGADAILLIVAALNDNQLKSFQVIARILGLAVLVEVHSEEELGRALSSGASVIGINNRNLHTFEVDLETTGRLAPLVPTDKIVISESGIKTREDIEYLLGVGVNGVLIGEAFMRSKAIGSTMSALLGRSEIIA